MAKDNLKVKILIDFDEYELLLRKAELHDKSLTQKLQQGGSSLEQIVAKNISQEELLPEKEDIFVEETAQTGHVPVVVEEKNQDFNKFDEISLLSKLKKNQQKKAKEIIRQIKEQGDQLTFDSSGQVFIEGKSIPGSNISKLLENLFSAKSNAIGFQDFVKKLQQMGLARFLPKKSLPMKEEHIPKIEQSPYNLDYWYYLGP